jgi:simple sugar transport system permease protein
MPEALLTIFEVGFFAAMVRIATPLVLATLGEVISERSGVLNLGIEGIMLLGAMVGFATAWHTGSLWLGIAAAIAVGALAGLVMSFLAVVLGVSQHVSGIGMTLLATGLAFYFYRLIFGQPGVPPNIEAFQPLPIPVLSDIPVLGPVLFSQTILTYIAFLAVPAVAFALYRTSWGLNLRTVGENPRAADAAGISVWGVRTEALVIGGGMMGLAGAYLTMAQFNAFTFGVVSGRGWVSIALVVFGQWNPWRCAAGALLIAALEA